MHDRLAIGTAQFGSDYGVAGGLKVLPDEARRIIQLSYEYRIDMIDTAILYGDCENILGDIGVSKLRVVTKLPPLPSDPKNIAEWVLKCVQGSLSRLRIPKLHGVLLHRPRDLLGLFGQELYSGLRDCSEQGLVEKIGISITDPMELDLIFNRYPVNLVQTPFNVFDCRIESSGWLDRLHDSEIELHVRSVFLQGLLLMEKEHRPKKFNRWNKLWGKWHCWIEENQTSALNACLSFAMSRAQIDRVIVGVNGIDNFRDILESLDCEGPIPPTAFGIQDVDLVNPSRWNLL